MGLTVLIREKGRLFRVQHFKSRQNLCMDLSRMKYVAMVIHIVIQYTLYTLHKYIIYLRTIFFFDKFYVMWP